MTVPGPIADELGMLKAAIADARRNVAGGTIVDLRPLGERVDALCREVSGLSRGMDPEERAATEAELQTLVADIESLEDMIRSRREDM